MAPSADPWRTLGLAPGATQDEIRRAYRRLAKANHPDAAGDAALPRFLAIQQAYDQLAGPGRVRRSGGRPGASTPPPAADPREPWRADPGRARASGRADGRRSPGARPGGAAGPGAPGAASSGPGEAAGPTAGAAGAGTGSGSGRARRSSGRRRASNRATPGSTSYEGADEEPFEPGWSGAGWYGASSGTYWTINPKEYADPRKHGPEYQARARRSAGAPSPDEALDGGPGDAPAAEATTDRPGPARAADPRDRPTWTSAAARDGAAGDDAGSTTNPPPGAARAARPAAPASNRQPRDAAFDAAPPARRPPPLDRLRDLVDEPPSGRFRAPFMRVPTTPTGRLAMAAVGWPPLGMFLGALVADATGCGRYAASCSEVSSPGTWIVNAVLVLLLLALPRLATWSAHGTIAALVAGVPSAIALSAGGGSNVPAASGPVLMAVLAVAYLGGVAYAIVRQAQFGSLGDAAGRRVP